MKRALIVEDHMQTVENLATICEDAGCRAYMAMSLAEAKSMIKEKEFHLIIWDFNLPDGNSLELIKVARKKNPEAVMIATSSDPENRALQMIAGCNLEASPYEIYQILEEEVKKIVL